MKQVYLNGKFIAESEALIPIADRGFKFGDGVFETMRVINGQIFRFEEHFRRLTEVLSVVQIVLDKDSTILKKICDELIARNGLQNCLVRISITRGSGGVGYTPIDKTNPTILVETSSIPEIKSDPIKLCISNIEKISGKALPVRYKTMQGLNSTLVKLEAKAENCFDGILLDKNGKICETSSANIFLVKNNILYTPSLSCDVREGVMRQFVIENSPVKVIEGEFAPQDLVDAEEIFLTNVAYPILSVDSVVGYNTALKKFIAIEIGQKALCSL